MMRTHLRDEFELLERIGALDASELAAANARGHAAAFVRSARSRITPDKYALRSMPADSSAALASLPCPHSRLPMLTDRQRQVVELIASGCSNDEIGERLGISPRTAKAHCDVLRQKLGVARRRQIPVAYRLLTGDDPLSRSLEVGPSRRRGLTARARGRSGRRGRDSPFG